MRAQLEHLLALMTRDNVELDHLPVIVAVQDGLDGDFLLLDFEEAQSIGYLEYSTGVIYLQDQDQVGACICLRIRLCAAALSESDSADAIVARIETLTTSWED
jgi:Domain of unknown function (DUF5753)